MNIPAYLIFLLIYFFCQVREETYAAFENIYPVLTEFRKSQQWYEFIMSFIIFLLHTSFLTLAHFFFGGSNIILRTDACPGRLLNACDVFVFLKIEVLILKRL